MARDLDRHEWRVGTAGWNRPRAGTDTGARHPLTLARTAEVFDTTEVSSTFYEFPSPEVSRLWVRQTEANPRFRFTAKLHRAFTHDRLDDEAGIERFRAGLRPLAKAGRLGCLLMQFPWSFKFTPENRDWLVRLRRHFREFPLAAEMRHASWMRDEALGTFIDYRLAFCNIDQPQYAKAMPPTAYLTTGIALVRLHGRNCFRWFQPGMDASDPMHRYDHAYTAEELADWQRRIDFLRGHAAETYVIFNNDSGPKAVAGALEMQSQLGASRIPMLPAEAARMVAQAPLFDRYEPAAKPLGVVA